MSTARLFFPFPGKLSLLTTHLCTHTIEFYRLPRHYDTLPLRMVPVLEKKSLSLITPQRGESANTIQFHLFKKHTGVCARARACTSLGYWLEMHLRGCPALHLEAPLNSYQDESCLNRFPSSLFALRFTWACKWC